MIILYLFFFNLQTTKKKRRVSITRSTPVAQSLPVTRSSALKEKKGSSKKVSKKKNVAHTIHDDVPCAVCGEMFSKSNPEEVCISTRLAIYIITSVFRRQFVNHF